jgi:selenocysteine-specific elongation factor
MHRNFIMGTAGHVDHGKTALIKALTNIECDTHKEEKKRGITINLGFAHISHPEGFEIGIVDVPGHKKFINTMVCGVSGINFVLFIIAADSGIMPQTIEHLKILDALGVNNGIIAITKIDMVEPELVELAREEIIELVKGTFLENANICEVSSKTKKGIDTLKYNIFQLITDINSKKHISNNYSAPFRMNIDRLFSLKGTGTIITGSAVSGTLKYEDQLFLLPNNKSIPLKIRSMQKYKTSTENLFAGERAAINVTGIKKEMIKHQTVASNRELTSSLLIDAKITLFDNSPQVYNKDITLLNVRVLLGALNTQAKIKTLFKIDDNENKKTSFFVQIKLYNSCISRYGDRFIIRNSSENKTLGSGIILDPSPLTHRKKTAYLKDIFLNFETKGIAYLIQNEVYKKQKITNIADICSEQNLSFKEVDEAVDYDSKIYMVLKFKTNSVLIDRKFLKVIFKNTPKIIKRHYTKLPLSRLGLTTEAITDSLNLEEHKSGIILTEYILNQLKKDEVVKLEKGTWVLASHETVINEKLQEQIDAIEAYFLNSGMTVPLLDKLKEFSIKIDITEKYLQQILKHLTGMGKIYRIENSYIHSNIVDSCRSKLIAYLNNNKDQGITIAEFRNLVNGNRKICLLLMLQFDQEKTTLRKEDYRFLHSTVNN